ncbi:MAG: N-acetylglutaminylglutamine amidotransferase, partial [Pseudomonadota bacterium]
MCGFCGIATFNGSTASLSAIEAMVNAMTPRGPDAGGALARGRLALGHRRLKIIDLSEHGQQPMVDSDLGLDLVFNGCIYNYQALRAELEGLGYRFFSTSDTEVILKAHHAWGEGAPTRLYGMFAYAVHERDTGRLWLVRDRFGIKPLYYAENEGVLTFASSLPALLKGADIDRTIDPAALHNYMSFHAVVPPPRTILAGVRKLPTATIRRIEPDGTFKDTTYWAVDFGRTSEEEDRAAEDWEEALLAALKVAVDRRMIADVPVGVLLSGGVDSSLIVALLAAAGQTDLKTFSIGFEAAHGESGDEFTYSDLVAKTFDTDHHKLFIPSSDLMDALPATIHAMSEPMVSYDNVAFFLLSREVAKHVKVVQSGQGADEVFAGYHWYPKLTGSNDPLGDYAAAFFDRDHEKMARHLMPSALAEDASRAVVAAHFDRPGAEDPVDKALRLDTDIMLADDPVKRVDNMTMAWGLEARVPFLDHELVELAA